MIQRYDLECHGYQGSDLYERDDGDYCRWSDVEPLLPRWVPTSERLPSQVTIYHVVIDFRPHGGLQCTGQQKWEGDAWLDFGDVITHWLDFQLPALPPLPSEAT